jgi:hypothetical protein
VKTGYNGKIKPTVSRYEKEKNNFERQIAVMDYYDTFNGSYRDTSRLDKFGINYDLANGRLDTSLYDSEDWCMIGNEQVSVKKGEIPHIPMIAQVVNALIGEEIARPWKLSVDDESPLKDSIETEEYRKLFKQYIDQNIIAPQEAEAQQRLQIQMQGMDMSQISPEQMQEMQAQMQQQIGEEVAFNTPEQIMDYMSNDYQNPIARQAQEIITHLDKKFEIKQLEIEGFTHMLPTSEEYYYVNIGEHGLEFDMVPPDSLTYGGPKDEVWVQKMDWAKREKWTTITDVRMKYAQVLKPAHIAELDKYYEPKYGSQHYDDVHGNSPLTRRYMFDLSSDPEGFQNKYGNQDYRLKENTINIAHAYSDIMNKYGEGVNLNDFAVRETHIVWKEFRVMYRVYRMVDGKPKRFFFDEHYVPVAEDLDVKRIEAPEIWEGTKIGTDDPIYLNIRPLQGQYPSADNPYVVELPYIGRKYKTFRGRSENVSIIDLMKQFNRDIDQEMASLRKDLDTNLGKIITMNMKLKPQNWTWSSFFQVAKDHSMFIIDPDQKGSNNVDPNFLREMNLDKMTDISNRLFLIKEMIANLYAVAGFSHHRAGQGGQYANAVNIQTQQQSSYNQTEPMFETHRVIVEKACNRLMNLARVYYKENPDELRNILSPTSFTELEFGYPFWYAYFNVRLENSGKVARQVAELKQYMQAFIQNGWQPIDIIALASAESRNDLIDIAQKIDKRQKEEMAAAQQAQQAQMQEQMAAMQQAKAEENQVKFELEKMKQDSALQRVNIDVDKFRLANDVDANGKADLLEAKMLELEQRAKEHEDKMELARQQQNETTVSARI